MSDVVLYQDGNQLVRRRKEEVSMISQLFVVEREAQRKRGVDLVIEVDPVKDEKGNTISHRYGIQVIGTHCGTLIFETFKYEEEDGVIRSPFVSPHYAINYFFASYDRLITITDA
jgi:hypothetical protein